MSDLRDLYQEVILDHGKRPRNFRHPADANREAKGDNPLCGDKVTIYLKLSDQGLIEDVAFEGRGCAISTASASLMTELLKGKTQAEAEALFGAFHQMCTSDDPPEIGEALQDEFIRFQGPYCPALEGWLRDHGDDYAAVLFCTYLYPTTYFAIRATAPRKAIFVPTLHDELPAQLTVFARLYARYPQRIWLTPAERRTAARIWGFDQGEVLGMAVEHTASARAEIRDRPYLLYCGRIEAGKGCDELLRAYARLPSRGRVSLVLTGADNIGLPD